MRWRPLSVRDDPKGVETYDALHDGVPPWLRVGLARWVADLIHDAPYGVDPVPELHILEQFLRFPLNWGYGLDSALEHLTTEVGKDGPRALDIIDACLMLSSGWSGGWKARESLNLMLLVGGSAWTVASDPDGTPCLERRVLEPVEQAARTEMERGGNAGRHLQSAWHAVYGRSTDASAAYREAVRAVEAAAKPVVTPADPVATLGKMICALRDKPTKWTTSVGSVESVADMMGSLWTSQLDRHGTDDESVALSVSPAQAEAAVHLAATLVHWFRSDQVVAAP